MGARTGEQFLEGLRDGREVWVDGERIADVTTHPSLSGAAHTIAELFDLQHERADVCLVPDEETGELINITHVIPRSIEDLRRRAAAIEVISEYTAGLMGRSPDYLNVTFAGFAGSKTEWSIGGNEAGAERLVEFQKELRRRDLSLTHTIIHATNDKAIRNGPLPDDPFALRKVGENERGIVVKGSRILATLAPFSDEIAVYPAAPLGEDCEHFALSFSIPMSTPGLRTLCRDSYSSPPDRFRHPLSSRFDEQDALMIFDSVEVPWDRIFIDGSIEAYNAVPRTGWFPNLSHQSMIRAQTKLTFAYGLATRIASVVNDTNPATQQMLGEIACYAEIARDVIRTAENEAHDYGDGTWFPAGPPLSALRAMLPLWFPRVNEIIRMIGSHNLLATPSEAELEDEVLGPLVEHYLQGGPEVGARERIATYRLAWDFAASAMGSRNEQYERFYLASSPTSMRGFQARYDGERGSGLVDQFLPVRPDPPA